MDGCLQIFGRYGPSRCKSKSIVNPGGGKQPSIQGQISSRDPIIKKRICKSTQEQLPAGAIAFPALKTGHGTGLGSILTVLIQPHILGSQTRSHSWPFSSLQTGGWVNSLAFDDAYFHISVSLNSRKYLRFHYQKQNFQYRTLPFRLSTAPKQLTIVMKEVKLTAQAHHNLSPPVPQLVDQG